MTTTTKPTETKPKKLWHVPLSSLHKKMIDEYREEFHCDHVTAWYATNACAASQHVPTRHGTGMGIPRDPWEGKAL